MLTVKRLTIAASLVCASILFAAEASRRAPGFSLADSKAQQHDLADYRGRPVILEFIQTTCPICNAFASVLAQVQQKYGDRVAVLTIVNPPDDPPKVAAYTASHKITYPILFDCGQVAYSYLRMPSFDVPHVYLIDANGAIREDFGYSDSTKDIFEGKGIFPHLDAMLKK
jgi:peroxiredoxin